MFKLEAPYPAVQTTSLLPNPEFGDSDALTASVQSHRSMTGKRFTYVRTKGGRRKLLFRFLLTRAKSFELRYFLESYFASEVRITDHLNRVWVGYFVNNPFEFETPHADQRTVISLEFEGVQQ